jgi:oligoendopeptidase F
MDNEIPRDSKVALGWGWDKFNELFGVVASTPLSRETLEEFMGKWTALSELIDETFTRLHVATTRDTSDEEAKKLYYKFLDEVYPNAEQADHELKQKLLDSGLTPGGFEIPLKKMKVEAEIFRESNLPLSAQEQKLGVQYSEIMGAQTVEWEGKEVTIAQLRPIYYERDRALREKAWRLSRSRQLNDREKIGEIWAGLLDLRQEMGENAGFPDYRSYRWKQLKRFDYTPENCKEFHRAIEEVVVPVAKKIHEQRQEALGLDSLRPWDLQVDVKGRDGLKPFKDVSELKEGAGRIFHNLSERLARHYGVMVREDLLDLENRKNKAPGGYCTDFAVKKRPFIFMNAVGIHDDVQTLLHEAGHCFHVFEKAHLPYYQQHETPMEFAEVASMSMELLAASYLERSSGGFYSESDAKRAFGEHLEQSILFWPYMAVVDAFQHWVYENPGLSANLDNCGDKWIELSERFMPGVDWRGLEEERSNLWQRQIHVIEIPFYYVEYGLAQLGAAQIWGASMDDQDMAVRRYLEALGKGGAASLPELYETAGARLAFDEATLTYAVGLMEDKLSTLADN